jgi:hypothetical protein
VSVDKQLLLLWLATRATTEGAVVGAIYDGLISRVKRGDFDEEEVKGQ